MFCSQDKSTLSSSLSSQYLSFSSLSPFFRAGKLNNHLEAAIQEAMSELDKMSGTVSNSDSLTAMYY